ncbi:hypothetical protein M0802_008813 [Mischocyttarus mexicanus]|nr:hypothetical protein M0802_008813 [Mischocyttarus mexicanus]
MVTRMLDKDKTLLEEVESSIEETKQNEICLVEEEKQQIPRSNVSNVSINTSILPCEEVVHTLEIYVEQDTETSIMRGLVGGTCRVYKLFKYLEKQEEAEVCESERFTYVTNVLKNIDFRRLEPDAIAKEAGQKDDEQTDKLDNPTDSNLNLPINTLDDQQYDNCYYGNSNQLCNYGNYDQAQNICYDQRCLNTYESNFNNQGNICVPYYQHPQENNYWSVTYQEEGTNYYRQQHLQVGYYQQENPQVVEIYYNQQEDLQSAQNYYYQSNEYYSQNNYYPYRSYEQENIQNTEATHAIQQGPPPYFISCDTTGHDTLLMNYFQVSVPFETNNFTNVGLLMPVINENVKESNPEIPEHWYIKLKEYNFEIVDMSENTNAIVSSNTSTNIRKIVKKNYHGEGKGLRKNLDKIPIQTVTNQFTPSNSCVTTQPPKPETELKPYFVPQKNVKSSSLIIFESSDSFAFSNDNLVIFINYKGIPLDSGAIELKNNELLPKYKRIIPEIADVTSIMPGKFLISLPINDLLSKQYIMNVFKSLLYVVRDYDLKSLSFSKTHAMVIEGQWRKIINALEETFYGINLIITVYNAALVNILYENVNEVIKVGTWTYITAEL